MKCPNIMKFMSNFFYIKVVILYRIDIKMGSTSEYHKLTLSFDSIKFIDDLPKVSLCFTQP
jgi:hypothetical protein